MKAPDVVLVAVTLADDSVAIMHFVTAEYGADGKPRWKREATHAEVQREIDKSSLGQSVKGWRFVQADEIPADRTFRNALRDRGLRDTTQKLEIDMPVAREIHRDRIRRAREPKLAALDVEYQRTGEIAETLAMNGVQFKASERARIAKQKEALRNAPADPAIDAAQTPEELKAAWPEALQ